MAEEELKYLEGWTRAGMDARWEAYKETPKKNNNKKANDELHKRTNRKSN